MRVSVHSQAASGDSRRPAGEQPGRESEAPLAGTSLKLDDSFGLAAQAGADVDITDTMFANSSVRCIDGNTDAGLAGAALEDVEIEPLVYSLSVGWKLQQSDTVL